MVLDGSLPRGVGLRMAAAVAAAAAMLWTSTVSAAEKPLWEVGFGVGAIVFNDYRGADTSHVYPLPVPYIVYRGKFLKSDYDGVRGQFLSNRFVEVKLSLNATTPVNSRDTDARAGMPDLQPTFEVGPEVDVHLWKSADRRVRFDLQVPVRRAITLTTRPGAIGWFAAPCLDLDFFSIEGYRGWNAGMQAGPVFADRAYNRHFYEVAPQYATTGRPAYAAPGGFAGTEFLLSTSRKFPHFWVFVFARYDSLSGASFSASPLVRSRSYWLGGVGIAWMIGHSNRYVHVAEPLD